jgi:hypothetical protein
VRCRPVSSYISTAALRVGKSRLVHVSSTPRKLPPGTDNYGLQPAELVHTLRGVALVELGATGVFPSKCGPIGIRIDCAVTFKYRHL